MEKIFFSFLFNTLFYTRQSYKTIRMSFGGLRMLKSPKLTQCYSFASVNTLFPVCVVIPLLHCIALNYLIPSIFHQPRFWNLIVKQLSNNLNATPKTPRERFAAKALLMHREWASARNTAGTIVTRVAVKTFIQVELVSINHCI